MGDTIYVGDLKACWNCKYSTIQNEQTITCSYSIIKRKSRTFDEKGKRRLPKGYCDKFDSRERK